MIYEKPYSGRVYVFLPYLRRIDQPENSKLVFKNTFDDLGKEDIETKKEIGRIASSFRQRETWGLDMFSYTYFDLQNEVLEPKIKDIKDLIEVYRFVTCEPNGKGLHSEHTTVYLIVPTPGNPRVFEDKVEHFLYEVSENFSNGTIHISYPHVASRPVFYKNIHSNDPPYIDGKYVAKLFSEITTNDLRAIGWYNKTFSIDAIDQTENLLHLSVAFEAHFNLDESEGKVACVADFEKDMEKIIDDPGKLKKVMGAANNYLGSKTTKRLTEKVFEATGNQRIANWFRLHFYSTGSAARHGDEILTKPIPNLTTKKPSKSTWYGEGATHDFLNNVYFGRRLFWFLIKDSYPTDDFSKRFEVENLEKFLISDEERLKILSDSILIKNPGTLTKDDLAICFDLGRSYFGSKTRVFSLLKRVLEELKSINPKLWTQLKEKAEFLLNANVNEDEFADYEKFKPYAHAIIDLDGILNNNRENEEILTDEVIKEFYIRRFISSAVSMIF